MGAARGAKIRGVRRPTGVRKVPVALASFVSLVSLASLFSIAGVSCARSKPATTSASPVSSKASSNDAVVVGGPDGSHYEALARLASAPWGERLDKRRTIALPMPDAPAWTHVKFFGVTTLAGWRYGDDHHAVAAAFVFDAPSVPASLDGCSQSFANWGSVRADAFDLKIAYARVTDVPWAGARGGQPAIARIFVVDAHRRSVFGVARYPSAYAVYPAWSDACLVLGISVPEDEAGPLAAQVRDRFVRDALPSLVAKPGEGQNALEAKIDVE